MRFTDFKTLFDFARSGVELDGGELILGDFTYEISIKPSLSDTDPIIIDIGDSTIFVHSDCCGIHSNPYEFDKIYKGIKDLGLPISYSYQVLIDGTFSPSENMKIVRTSAFRNKESEILAFLTDPDDAFTGWTCGDFELDISPYGSSGRVFELQLSRSCGQ